MPRYKAPTIAERGGLEAYLTSLNLSYALFKQLRSSIGDKYSVIAAALTKDAKLKKPLRPGRVKHWCMVDDIEQENKTSE
jgi:hypothetical protein